MNENEAHAPILIFAYGNPSRGDDALGPAMADLLETHLQQHGKLDSADVLTDYQLQIEHAVDLEHRQCALFIDASVSCPAPFTFQNLEPLQDDSYTTHAMSPAAVLAVYRKINRQQPPPAYMLSIRGYEFKLGQAISTQAEKNLDHGFKFIQSLLDTDIGDWNES